MDRFLDTIIAKKVPCFFISPHFDDAALSAGGLISSLSGKVPLTVVNVFTKAGTAPYTLSAKAFLGQTGFPDAQRLYKERKKEDTHILKQYVDTVYNLDFTDALWRKKKVLSPLQKRLSRFLPEISSVYPTYKFHITKGIISEKDKEMMALLARNLSFIPRDSIVFCPLGIGKHVDHVIVHEVCKKMFGSPIYWMDFPYSERTTTPPSFKNGYSQVRFSISSRTKEKIVKQYKTQYTAMFGDGPKSFPAEYYYLPKKIL